MKLKELKEKFDNKNKVNYRDLNDILKVSKQILKIFLILIIILAIYITVIVFKELKIPKIVMTIISILTPFFIGITVAWILNPVVNYLEKKKVRRLIGALLSYVVLIAIIYFIFWSIIPLAYQQLKELIAMLPSITRSIETFINNLFGNIGIEKISGIKGGISGFIKNYMSDISSNLPDKIISIAKVLISGTGVFLIGLLIGFFLLLGFTNISDSILIFIPNSWHDNYKILSKKIDKALRGYFNGAMFDALIIFVACSIAFALIGLKSPILFALFCAIMNVIPYAGPYLGAVPALIVGLTQSMTVGIWVGISIIIIQLIEGNILSPIVMSKTTKLHPVTIILGLLISGHFFGIVGMLLSTPIISVFKVIVLFIDSKFNIFNDSEE